MPDDQSAVIRFLDGGAGRGTPAKRIDTHGAMIFLIGLEALKLKRAVTYDYMDLSTVDKRRAMLDREYELNKPAAPSIYRKVQPIVRRADGTLALGRPGTVVDWVLTMNRFPPEAELSHIATHGGIDDDLAARLGTAIARYHDAAPVKRLNGRALIADVLDELDRVFATLHDPLGPEAGAVLSESRTVLSLRGEDLARRSRQGYVRRCHGDLHLRNIVMVDGVPTPFDALEFDERLGTCDTLYDLAFLLMDLGHLGMDHTATLVLNAYLAAARPDLSDTGLSLLPLYLTVRAAIRAMVDVQTGALPGADGGLRADARAYLAQALTYLAPPPPVLVAIGGYSGSGKTTVARAVAHLVGPRPGAIHVRSDVVRKTLLHHDPLDPLGAEGYAPEITERTYAAIRDQAGHVLRQGHAVVLDAVHADADARGAARAVAASARCAFVGLWLETPTRTRLVRVETRGPDASDADAQVVRAQDLNDPGPIDWHRIDTDQPLDAVIRAVSAILGPSADAIQPAHGE